MNWFVEHPEVTRYILEHERSNSMAKTQLTVGTTVRILPHPDSNEEPIYVGMVGELVDINEHNDDGDFYGVRFPVEETLENLDIKNHIIYFFAVELEGL